MIDQDSNRTVRLMHALGLQGGTVWEVCRLLGCVFDDVYHRGPERFEELLLKARSIGDAKRAAAQVEPMTWADLCPGDVIPDRCEECDANGCETCGGSGFAASSGGRGVLRAKAEAASGLPWVAARGIRITHLEEGTV